METYVFCCTTTKTSQEKKKTTKEKKKEAMPHHLSTNNCYERQQKPTAISSFFTNLERKEVKNSFEKKAVQYCPSIC